MSQPFASASFAPKQRITPELRQRLRELAPKFLIEVAEVPQATGGCHIRLTGPGFRSPNPVVLAEHDALFRLFAEICSILTRWVSFNPLEPAEVTLVALPLERIERCAGAYRKHIAHKLRTAQKAAVTQQALEALSALKQDSLLARGPDGQQHRPATDVDSQRTNPTALPSSREQLPEVGVSALPGAS